MSFRIELELLLLEIEVAKSLDVTSSDKDVIFSKMVLLRNNSPLFNQNSIDIKKRYYDWLRWNVYENKLSYPSSGSFLVAVEDYDNNINMLGPENELTEEQIELFDKLWNEIIKENEYKNKKRTSKYY